MQPYKNLIRLLEARADEAPERGALEFLTQADGATEKITYSALADRARSIASLLQDKYGAGQRALLVYPSGLEFIKAFWGCLYAGIIPVPVHTPRSGRDVPILSAIADDCEAAVVLSTEELLPLGQQIASSSNKLQGLDVIATEQIAGSASPFRDMPDAEGNSIAYLQYTSGSTRQPRGVMVTYNNVLSNLEYIDQGFAHSPSSVLVSWLPHFHDMGLVYGILEPVFRGIPGVLMAAATFVQNPAKWLQAIHKWRATHSGGPNFAYDLCVDRVTEDESAELNLCSWRVAFNGAEPVLRETMERFAQKFSKNGFRRQAFCPAYGLAEATLKISSFAVDEEFHCLGVSQTALQSGAVRVDDKRSVRWLVACGQPGAEVRVVIVDPYSRECCRAKEVGEIWVQSAGVALGYWNRPEDTKNTFVAFTADGQGPFLRTGDLGFLQDGQLYVTGRFKDLIIVHGRNYYAEDIEASARNASPELCYSVQVAFAASRMSKAEAAVLVQEISPQQKPRASELARTIANAVLAEHGIQISRIYFVLRREIPKTSSGKVRRSICRQGIEKGSIKIIECVEFAAAEQVTSNAFSDACQADKDRIEHYLLKQVERFKGDSYCNNGKLIVVDSLQAAELSRALAHDFNIKVSMERFLRPLSISQLAEELAQSLQTKILQQPPENVPASDSDLSIEQERLWFLDQIEPGNPAFNITAGVFLRGKLDQELLRASLVRMLEKHEVLRAGFHGSDGVPRLTVEMHNEPELAVIGSPFSVSEGSTRLEVEAVRERLRRESLKRFSLGSPPLIACSLLQSAEDEHFLIVRMHHIIGDGHSMLLFMQRLLLTYASLGQGPVSGDLSEDTSYFSFTRWQRGNPPPVEAHSGFWKKWLENGPPEFQLPYDRECADQIFYEARSVSFDVPADLQTAILKTAEEHNTTPFTFLLACSFALLYALTHQQDLMIGVPMSGRSIPGVEKTIGLFAFPMPIQQTIAPVRSFADLLAQTHNAALEVYAHSELSFSQLMQMSSRRNSRLVSPFKVMVTNLNTSIIPDYIAELETGPVLFANGAIDCDLSFMFSGAQDLTGTLAYNAARFDAATAKFMVDTYLDLLRAAAMTPDVPVNRLCPEKPAARSKKCKLLIASSFMAGDVSESLHFWKQKLQLPHVPEILDHGQIVQQLLDPVGPLRSNGSGLNVILLRLEDIASDTDLQMMASERVDSRIRLTVSDLVTFLGDAVKNSTAEYMLCICPPAAASMKDQLRCEMHLRRLRDAASQVPNLVFIDYEQILSLYPVADCHDLQLEQLSGIPFTSAFFTALGTVIARFVWTENRPPKKVIVLDCDNTLWQGACGELGCDVQIGPPFEMLQRFMVAQAEAGMLLCLSSKNEEQDVMSIFDNHHKMVLRRDQLTAWRINWGAKSRALQSLSSELGLALDSFIFIDDDPVECAEVSLHCPEVLTLQLPEPQAIATYLQHVWFFDHWRPTRESTLRAASYEQNRKREQLRAMTPSLGEFLSSLQTNVLIRPAMVQDVSRMWELIQRTTQFNLSLKRRSTNEIFALLQGGSSHCYTVTVSDRFGEYGLVGLVIFESHLPILEVDTFLLSCRVLGRQIEHQMLVWLGEEALRSGLSEIRLPFRQGVRNRPAYEFLKTVAAQECPNGRQGEAFFTLPAYTAAQLLAGPTCGLAQAI